MADEGGLLDNETHEEIDEAAAHSTSVNESPASDEVEVRKQIEDYYLPKQLVDAIMEYGGIQLDSVETVVGIGFLDIADYTYLSKFLSPKENQAVLNGLYTAFNGVLKRHGGYLNKIEGDSLMFHYGGVIDPNVREMSEEDANRYIARELFYSCIEMQRVCDHFNQANEKFLLEGASDAAKAVLRKAFDIISTLRNQFEIASSINAVFQIRVRIGANIGEVTIGNFGPDGAKQWDVVGTPVIDAKRMESTAPIGGLRISERLYQILDETGIVDSYYQRFKREAQAVFGHYRTITKDEVFRYSRVLLKDKKDAEFRTYSVQVNFRLPEAIRDQVEALMNRGPSGADRILDLLQYYRGNQYVIDAIEEAFHNATVHIRKPYILETMYPKRFRSIEQRFQNDREKIDAYVDQEYSLYALFEKLGKFQDIIKKPVYREYNEEEFASYDDYMISHEEDVRAVYRRMKAQMVQRAYFYNVVFPLVFASIRTSILEYQHAASEVEVVAG